MRFIPVSRILMKLQNSSVNRNFFTLITSTHHKCSLKKLFQNVMDCIRFAVGTQSFRNIKVLNHISFNLIYTYMYYIYSIELRKSQSFHSPYKIRVQVGLHWTKHMSTMGTGAKEEKRNSEQRRTFSRFGFIFLKIIL